MAAPAVRRTFGFLDHASLWGSLGFGLLMLTPGALLVPALSLKQAFLAVFVAALLGALVLACVAAVAAQSGLPTVGLLPGPLGRAGPWLAAPLLLARHVGWAVFALVLAAQTAEAVSDDVFGVGLRPLWVVVFGAAGLSLAMAGPQFAVRQVLRKAGVWLALLIGVIITVSAYAEFGVPPLLQRPAADGWPSFWQAVDLMLVFPLLWLPLVADYARFSRGAPAAAAGTFAGAFLPVLWFGFLGVLYLPAVETGEVVDFVVAMRVGLLALLLILLLQADEVFVNGYSAAASLGGLVPGLGERLGVWASGLLVVGLALGIDFVGYEGFLLWLGSMFVPLFGVLLAHYALNATSGRDERPLLHAPGLLAWAAGSLLYHWIAPPDLGWWQDAMRWLFVSFLHLPFPLTEHVTWLGASVPSFAAGFVLYAVATPAAVLIRARLRPAPAQ